MRISIKSLAVLATGVAMLGACQHTTIGSSGTTGGSNMAALEASQTQSMINLKDVLDASTANIPTLTAVGYAVTSSQPGRSESQKRLMAIRSARMAASERGTSEHAGPSEPFEDDLVELAASSPSVGARTTHCVDGTVPRLAGLPTPASFRELVAP